MVSYRKPVRLTLLYMVLIPLLLILLFPFGAMLSASLKDGTEVYRMPPAIIPPKINWQNYLEVWNYMPLARMLFSSAVIATGATVLNTLLCIPAAYALANFRFRGRQLLLMVFLATQMFSPIVIIISLFKMMTPLLDSYWSLIISNALFSLSFSIWLLTGYFLTIPKEVEEAAMIDGASRLKALVSVILPLSMPGLVTTAIYTFITAWNEFMFAVTFISSNAYKPLTIGIYGFQGRFNTEWHFLMAASFYGIVPIIILFLLIERNLVKGLTAGAVK